ncbi:DUF1697 domain-containing protein [Kineococcus rubinsiae]|uniref:DUF1697 domain-containing protein n=1 Tax=Kineococcus rubinsiae TaxID=2609562 RepID=UPI001430CD71|nr:DUF1697 domain-containing protein [Kineococcus rubinsiae]NIZ89445.1 DUF1697 domain-containing protein [Kineococcus rubinsiae]
MRAVVLLRGVNVNGVTVRSADLARVLGAAGFSDVRTVLASGNVVLDPATDDAAQLARDVEQALRDGFGYQAWVVVVRPQRLAEIAAAYPFPRDDERFHPYCVFASDAGQLAELAALADPAGGEDLLQLAGDVLYWRVAKGSSTDTPFAKLAAAARWKPVITTRNLRTVEKVLAVASR